jgi:hypothetical protein
MPILTQLLPAIWLVYGQIILDASRETLFGDLIERCRSHFLVKLHKHLDFVAIEQACATYRHSSGPGSYETYPVAVLVRCLLVMYLEVLSYREMEMRLYSDMLVRWFCGLPFGDDIPDHTTLERFEQWVKQHQPRIYQDTVLKQIDERFPASKKLPQVADTYAMLANAAEEDLVTRLRHTARCLLAETNQAAEFAVEILSGFDGNSLFGVQAEQSVSLLDKKQRQQRLQSVVLAAEDLRQRFSISLQACSSQEYPDVRLWVNYLGKIIHDEVKILPEADADGIRIHRRTTKERRNDPQTTQRIGSATDPEASFRMHGDTDEDVKFGYNIQVAATTDGFIRETKAYTGAVSDQAGIAQLVADQKEHHGICPPKLIYDQAAGSGKARADVDKASDGQTLLVSKLIPYAARSDRFGPYDFTLSEDGKTLTCPAGKQSDTAYASGEGDGRTFRFFACQCWLNSEPPTRMKNADLSLRCPLWEKCRDDCQGPGAMRQVYISDYRNYVLAAQIYNQTDAFAYDMKLRPQIERIIFELTNYNGARYCRSRGVDNADWQARMCTVSYNLKLWMRKVGRRERAALAVG